ncbi:MAG: Holliday junction branch migration protein RuvA [Gammaproteobacteria bacterium]|nr:Holliday junction branch migration protein RuvA [Gammaproteobacteria bacterium]
MIGRLRGIVLEKAPPFLLLDVQGVGYEIEAPMSTFYNLPLEKNAEVIIHTHLVIREDAHLLFGFASLSERSLFRTLIKINGVGAKMALAILSGMDSDEFAQCILAEDASALTRLPGVGKKTAERLIVEMRDKLPKFAEGPESVVQSGGKKLAPTLAESPAAQASAALVSLGYKPAEAGRMVSGIDSEDLTVEEIIRLALKNMAKK